MQLKLLALAAALLPYLADAACPNLCSGHGTCGVNEKCDCYPTWTGADCSQRTCKFGRAWAADDNDPHAYLECSGQGACNRASGECACFPGFSGYACSRLGCPNGCSGNGRCVLISDVNTTVAYDSLAWDAGRIETCDCDPGFFGPDCSQRRCPTGDDPMTVCTSNVKSQVQELRFTLGSKVAHDATTTVDGTYTGAVELMDLFGTKAGSGFNSKRAATGQLQLTYVDSWGGAYTAHGIGSVLASDGTPVARDEMEVALETLPNQKVRDVVISTAMTKAGDANNGGVDGILQRRYLVTFTADLTHSNNVGLQNPLQCPSGYSCTEPGCQPMVSMPFLYRYAGMVQDTPLGQVVAGADVGSLSSVAAYQILFFTGAANTDAAAAAGKFVRLHPDSQPQLPLGLGVDDAATAADPQRYDIRILIAVMDPSGAGDNSADVFYTRVIYGNDAINSNKERVGSSSNGVWGNGKAFTATLDGFTFNGPIPVASDGSSVASKVPVPGAPGVFLAFDSTLNRNYVASDNQGRWYEILIKLPSCRVTPVTKANQVKAFGASTFIAPVDVNVENVECSSRGKCNRKTGVCACFSGFAGIACQTQSTLVV